MFKKLAAVGAPDVQTQMMTADVDGNGYPDILLSAGGGKVYVILTAADGTPQTGFAASSFDQLASPEGLPDGIRLRPSRFPVAAGDLDGDGIADYAGTAGVYLASGDSLVRVMARQSPEPWVDGEALDIDGDGLTDLAILPAAGSGIELLLNRCRAHEGSRCTEVTFEEHRLPTAGPPVMPRRGDFNGDGIDDLAYLERGGDEDGVFVAYGQVGGLPLQVHVATWPTLLSLEVRRGTTARVPDDLVLTHLADQGPDRWTAQSELHGSSGPLMYSIFAPPDGLAAGLAFAGAGRSSLRPWSADGRRSPESRRILRSSGWPTRAWRRPSSIPQPAAYPRPLASTPAARHGRLATSMAMAETR